MATPFFGKRDNETPTGVRPAATGGYAGSSSGTLQSASQSASPLTPTRPTSDTASPVNATPEGGSKLTVGPNIKLKGVEITDCDTLVVEGMVEATMDSRVIQIAEQGAFKGSAEIDVAEIRGLFEGSLTVRDRLTIFSTGKVTGVIRYGKLVVEEGGQLSGEIQSGAKVIAKPTPTDMPKTGLQSA